jgi:hypothetical protein
MQRDKRAAGGGEFSKREIVLLILALQLPDCIVTFSEIAHSKSSRGKMTRKSG